MTEIQINTAAPTEVDSASVQAEGSTSGQGTLSATDSALHESDRSSDSSFVNTKDDTSSQRGDTSDADANENDVARRCSRKWILEHFKKEWKMYYRTFELNEKLYFHYKGFERIENMELFPELKCLYWEGNGVVSI